MNRFFFILPTSVLLYRAFRVFFHAKEIDAFHPSPNFLTSPCPQEGEPSFSERTSTAACFFLCSGPKSLRFEPRSFFHRTVFHKCGRGIHRSSAAGRHHQIRRRARCFHRRATVCLLFFWLRPKKNNVFPEPQDEFSKSNAFLFGIHFRA